MTLTLECALRILLACLCGGLIGFERTKRLKEAGIRTHCIIASAAALLMVISKYAFLDISVSEGISKVADPARIAAQVVSGISFLGAGVIFQNGSSVKGLTTAAGIWSTAAAGLAIGCGFISLGILLTVLVVAIQLVFHRFSIGNDAFSESDVKVIANATPEFREKLFDAAEKKQIQILSIRIDREKGPDAECTVVMRTKKQMSPRQIAEMLENFDSIKSIMM